MILLLKPDRLPPREVSLEADAARPAHPFGHPELVELQLLLQQTLKYQFRRQTQLRHLKQEVERLRLARTGF